MTFGKILYTEWLKTKRSPTRWIAFGTPIAYAVFFICYYSTVNASEFSMFQIFFACWTTICVPFGIGLLSGFAIHEEELAGNFNAFLGGNIPRSERYFGKLVILILFTTASTLTATLIFVIWASFIKAQFVIMIFIKAAVLSEISSLPLIAFNLWLSLWKGMGVSIGFGGAGVVIASLLAIVGDNFWKFIIWAWPVRLTLMQEYYIPKNMLLKYMNHSFILNELKSGFIAVAICFIIVLAGSLIWFKNWEGRKSYN